MRVVTTIAAVAFVVGLAGCSKPQTASAPPVAEPTPAEKQAALASLPAPYNSADLANGEAKFALCRSCHTIVAGAPNMTGPNLYGVFGHPAGAVKGYAYSEALKTAGFTWDVQRLDAWLADPKADLPGNKMTFPGLKNPKDRIDVIAFLRVETAKAP